MKTKRKPRSWTFVEDKGEGLWTIVENGEAIMGNADYYPWAPDDKEAWHMIAAAPELLRAAQDALSDLVWIEKNTPGSNFQASIILLRAAIAKATGSGGID